MVTRLTAHGLSSWRPAGAWILKNSAAIRVPMPGWHLPQVWGSVLGLMVESGSLAGRMSWTPWQEAQLATVALPPLSASPWKLSS